MKRFIFLVHLWKVSLSAFSPLCHPTRVLNFFFNITISVTKLKEFCSSKTGILFSNAIELFTVYTSSNYAASKQVSILMSIFPMRDSIMYHVVILFIICLTPPCLWPIQRQRSLFGVGQDIDRRWPKPSQVRHYRITIKDIWHLTLLMAYVRRHLLN